ncbi:GNAT family N-acetyltransferase [Bacteroidales bacterium OttesenSCG-928-K03]|nr:GNAT family N-acetyltransferase [Odoribacter sp. OttesenSCG-928-L07]MDL2238680.1 GNAT family N-acetyltransferase [Bacteroidales bacterium OttesenSCG-928-L14]MDL2241029.1 GNAT family N-acetyltransferase [Bacteroidales bacterium OttesenSCG-928-K22]MDL2242663.1 GNAT family N-acetyltransferase [Bacteroidales bacterium OttesenSCG-928-K03]
MEKNIRKANLNDIEVLTTLFINNLEKHPEYISHGEMQMGVALANGTVAPQGSAQWKKYIIQKIESKDSAVFVYEDNNQIIGFTVVEIDNDDGDPFGVICDLYVLPDSRTKGLGSLLFNTGMNWLSDKGMKEFYLESGKDNHSAHEFFERRGFKMISHIYYKS